MFANKLILSQAACLVLLAVSVCARGADNAVEAPLPAAKSFGAVGEAGMVVVADEKAVAQAVLEAGAAANLTGAAAFLQGKKILTVTLGEALRTAYDKNLQIRYGRKTYDIADADLAGTKSTFMPVLDFSLSESYTDTYTRKEWIVRKRYSSEKLQSDFDNFEGAFNDVTYTRIVIDNQIVITPEGYSGVGAAASGINPFVVEGGWDYASYHTTTKYDNFGASLSQQIPWGSFLGLGFSTGYRKPQIPDDFWQRCWVANVSANLTVPLPWCKDFGPFGATDVMPKLAEITKDSAYWQWRSGVNSNLLETSSAYWETVRALHRLHATSANRRNVATIAAKTAELVGRRTTAYGKAQVDAELARVKLLEEQAWAAFLIASNRLAAALDAGGDTVFVPSGYDALLREKATVDSVSSLAKALEFNPDLMLVKEGEKYSQTWYKHNINQARPDLKLMTSLSYSQNPYPFGYAKFKDAMGALFDPDTESAYVGLQFEVPWGNNVANERERQAKDGYEQAKNAVKLQKNAVRRNVNDALAGVYSARSRVDVATTSRQLAALALENAQKLMEAASRVTEFEIIEKNNDVLQADYELIDALIVEKKAVEQLRAAEGSLAGGFMEK
jgi:outer membrane protein TolC